MTTPRFSLRSTVLGSPDPRSLASFYRALLDWEVIEDADDWVVLKPGGNRDATGLSFQREERHVPPTWPAGEGDQQMQLHLDIAVDDLAEGESRALALGAMLAQHQPQDDVRVLLDPAGHPFCLFQRS
ncbi:VOC family protein [Nocardioides sp.]|uniref:VOC family protein n=1 Tax=Nocardioides sp. TaxID=35761 RepID=UPI002D7F2FF9|nr:VOC family protein [Nocardioides sp.]HET8960918.1 VOC family protein [Nocardioides sp.]